MELKTYVSWATLGDPRELLNFQELLIFHLSTGDNNKQHLLSRAAERLKWTNVWRASATPPDTQSDSLEKTLMLGNIKGRRRRGPQRVRRLDGITDSMDMSLSKLREIGKDRKPWHAAVHGVAKVGHDWATEQWTSSHTVLSIDFFFFGLLWQLYIYIHIYISHKIYHFNHF